MTLRANPKKPRPFYDGGEVRGFMAAEKEQGGLLKSSWQKMGNNFPHSGAGLSPYLPVKPLAARNSLLEKYVLTRVAKMEAPGFDNFVPALAHHFWLALPATFSQPEVRDLTK